MPKCKHCKDSFEVKYFNQKYCLEKDECIKAFHLEVKEMQQNKNKAILRQKHKTDKENILSRSEWLNIAQKTFNTYIRLRDKEFNCISCNTNKGQFHAGHYRSVGSSPNLRFNEKNCHKQCATCNNYLSGNLILYRKNLILKIGIEEVEKIENDNSILKLSIPEIKELIHFYKQKIKYLKQ